MQQIFKKKWIVEKEQRLPLPSQGEAMILSPCKVADLRPGKASTEMMDLPGVLRSSFTPINCFSRFGGVTALPAFIEGKHRQGHSPRIWEPYFFPCCLHLWTWEKMIVPLPFLTRTPCHGTMLGGRDLEKSPGRTACKRREFWFKSCKNRLHLFRGTFSILLRIDRISVISFSQKYL